MITEQSIRIRETIRDYLRGKDVPASSDIQCFVEMIATGEATMADFDAVGGWCLCREVDDAISREIYS